MLPVALRRLRRYHPTRNAHYCLMRVVTSRPGDCEVDLDVLDQSGSVLMTVAGLRLAAGVSAEEQADRTLNERLLIIDWERRELPAAETDTGSWLLLSAAGAEDSLTARLHGALHDAGAHCATRPLPLDAAGSADVARLRALLDGALEAARGSGALAGLTGVVVVTAPPAAGSEVPRQGQTAVSQLVCVARELAALPGEVPRLYLVTRGAASVLPGDLANLEQAGLRGLMRVIDAEHPHLRATQIDLDEKTDARQVALQLQGGSEEDETAWRENGWYTARLLPGPLRTDERQTTVVEHEHEGMRLQIRTPGDLESLEVVACARSAPGPGQIEVAVHASSVNFADVLVAFGRYPTFEGYRQQLGIDFAGVVTGVGPDVTEHRVGDRVGGLSVDGCWGTFATCRARLAVTIPPEVPLEEAAAVRPGTRPPGTAYTSWPGSRRLTRC